MCYLKLSICNKIQPGQNEPSTKLSGKFQGVSSHRARGERRGWAVDVGVVEIGVVGLDGGWGGGPGLTMHHFGGKRHLLTLPFRLF